MAITRAQSAKPSADQVTVILKVSMAGAMATKEVGSEHYCDQAEADRLVEAGFAEFPKA